MFLVPLLHEIKKSPFIPSRFFFRSLITMLSNSSMKVSKSIHTFCRAIVKEVPEAVFCRSFLLSTGNLPSPSFATKRIHTVDDPSLSGSTEFPYFTQEELIWDKVKHFEGQKQFQDALQLLENTESRSLRLIFSQIIFYNFLTSKIPKTIAGASTTSSNYG